MWQALAGQPVARVALGQTLLTTLRKHYPKELPHVEGSLSGEAAQSFASLNALRWIPMDHHMELCDLIRGAVGEGEGNERFWEVSFEELLRRPLLSSFVQMILRVPEAPHSAMVHFGPRIFDHIFRDCGKSTTRVFSRPETPDFIGTWTLKGFPVERFTFMCFVEGFQGSIRGASGVFPSRKRIDAALESCEPSGDFRLAITVR